MTQTAGTFGARLGRACPRNSTSLARPATEHEAETDAEEGCDRHDATDDHGRRHGLGLILHG